MKFKKYLISKKSTIEKIRILYFRSKKKMYAFKTKNRVFNPRISLNKLSSSEFFLSEKFINNYSESLKVDIINEADKLINNIYRSISGAEIVVTGGINWSYDYIFGYDWGEKHFSQYRLVKKDNTTDVKHVWQLSRFYHLVTLAQAYVISKNEKYISKIVDDICTWDKQNVFNYSVNWTVTMEVAIRLVNLIQCLSLIQKSKLLTECLIIKFNNMIYKHIIFICNNLEKGLYTNNHYLSNLIGLIWGCTYFEGVNQNPISKITKNWLEFSLQQLEYELGYQIYDDGFSYEDSVSYHCLNTEMLLFTLIVMKKNRIKENPFIMKTSQNMLFALSKITFNNGTIPIIGDIDNGRLLIFDSQSNRDKTNFSYLFSIAREYFELDFLREKRSPVQLRNTGIFRIYNNTFDAIIRCGRIGLEGIGGHAHNDQLSIILLIRDSLFFTDPGTGYYGGNQKLRDELRSTKSHNTLYVENCEQNEIDVGMFKMKEKTNSELIDIRESSFEGQHFGYFDLKGLIYKRNVQISDHRIEIVDSLDTLPDVKCYVNFILDDDVKVNRIECVKNMIILEKSSLQIEFRVSGGEIVLAEQVISKSYSQVTKSNKIMILVDEPEIRTTITVI